MVNIGILGYASVGKTSLFNLFRKIFEERGGNILGGQLGGAKKGNTVTIDFIRFIHTSEPQDSKIVHTLYGTGGHRHRITDYYRSFVIRNSDVFICMFDLSIDLEPQLTFYEQFELPVRSIVLVFNKFDLAKEPIIEHFIDQTEDFFVNKKKKFIFDRFITCAIPKSQYALYNENAVNSVLILCN
ncbi:MAG: GTPase domain-containing protein [Candidatus Hodarchaeota archaeon]